MESKDEVKETSKGPLQLTLYNEDNGQTKFDYVRTPDLPKTSHRVKNWKVHICVELYRTQTEDRLNPRRGDRGPLSTIRGLPRGATNVNIPRKEPVRPTSVQRS